MAWMKRVFSKIADASDTPAQRLAMELAVSICLGVATAFAASLVHRAVAPATVSDIALYGTPCADDINHPQWLLTRCDRHGWKAVLSRPAASVDPVAVQTVLASQRESGAMPAIPRWSRIHAAAPSLLDAAILEVAHGWPMPTLYERATVHGSDVQHDSFALLAVPAAANALFFVVAWLFVLRLPASIRRSARWVKSRHIEIAASLPQRSS